jgi:hypothetical protein
MGFPEDLFSVLFEAFVFKTTGDACFSFAVFVCLSACSTSRTAEKIFIKFDGVAFIEVCRFIQVSVKIGKKTDTLPKDLHAILCAP